MASNDFYVTVHNKCVCVGTDQDNGKGNQAWIRLSLKKGPGGKPISHLQVYSDPNLDKGRRKGFGGGKAGIKLFKGLQDMIDAITETETPSDAKVMKVELEWIVAAAITGNTPSRPYTDEQKKEKDYWKTRRGNGATLKEGGWPLKQIELARDSLPAQSKGTTDGAKRKAQDATLRKTSKKQKHLEEASDDEGVTNAKAYKASKGYEDAEKPSKTGKKKGRMQVKDDQEGASDDEEVADRKALKASKGDKDGEKPTKMDKKKSRKQDEDDHEDAEGFANHNDTRYMEGAPSLSEDERKRFADAWEGMLYLLDKARKGGLERGA